MLNAFVITILIIATSASSNVTTVVYPFVNIFGSLVISWEEMREIAGSDHKIFDRVEFKRNEAIETMRRNINTGLFAAAQVANQVTALPVAVDATGATGGLNQTTVAGWASTETTTGATFAASGYANMLTTYNTIEDASKSTPDIIITTRALYELYEVELNPDVRYTDAQGKGVRGFSELQFKKTPIIFDGDCTANTMYFLNTEFLFPMVDTDGDFKLDPFETPVNQKVYVSKGAFRGNVICNQRRAQGKMVVTG